MIPKPPKGKMPSKHPIVRGVKRIDDPHSPRGYREVCDPAAWERRREEVATRAEGKCERCRCLTPFPHGDAHHFLEGRKMGGGFRDDHIDNLRWWCRMCHRVRLPASKGRGAKR